MAEAQESSSKSARALPTPTSNPSIQSRSVARRERYERLLKGLTGPGRLIGEDSMTMTGLKENNMPTPSKGLKQALSKVITESDAHTRAGYWLNASLNEALRQGATRQQVADAAGMTTEALCELLGIPEPTLEVEPEPFQVEATLKFTFSIDPNCFLDFPQLDAEGLVSLTLKDDLVELVSDAEFSDNLKILNWKILGEESTPSVDMSSETYDRLLEALNEPAKVVEPMVEVMRSERLLQMPESEEESPFLKILRELESLPLYITDDGGVICNHQSCIGEDVDFGYLGRRTTLGDLLKGIYDHAGECHES